MQSSKKSMTLDLGIVGFSSPVNCSLTYKICVSQDSAEVRRIIISRVLGGPILKYSGNKE